MMDLYYRRGVAPAALPLTAYDPAGNSWSDLANSQEGRDACGYFLAPELPDHDPATQGVTWSTEAERWDVYPLPPVVIVDPPPPPPAAPVITYKADVWRRSTDEQAAVIDTALTKLDVRMRRLWDDAAYLDHASPEFTLLRTTMVGAFGEEEAVRILAPSDG